MDTPYNNNSTPSSSRPLWIAVAALGTVSVALGATLAYTQWRAPAAERSAAAMAAEGPGTPGGAVKADDAAPKNAVKAPPKAPPQAPLVPHERQAVAGGTAAHPVYPPSQRQVCADCGQVEAVTPVQRASQGSGLGAVAGGVIGAAIGNQVGGGSGRTAATVLGAIGGGYAGNAVEKNIKREIVYEVRVRMEDGSVRTLVQATPPSLGARVTVAGDALRGSDGTVYAPARAPAQPVYPRDLGYSQNGG